MVTLPCGTNGREFLKMGRIREKGGGAGQTHERFPAYDNNWNADNTDLAD